MTQTPESNQRLDRIEAILEQLARTQQESARSNNERMNLIEMRLDADRERILAHEERFEQLTERLDQPTQSVSELRENQQLLIDPVPVGGKIYSWRIYHPSSPDKPAGGDYPSPIPDSHQWQFLISAEDDKGGYFVATLKPEEPPLHEEWKQQGWKIEFYAEMEKIAD